MKKSCDICSHSMESQAEGEVLCIAKPPVPIVTIQGQIISIFPSMMKWGKCDAFEKGKTQKQNPQPPEILEPDLKVIQ
mgnify:FL=1